MGWFDKIFGKESSDAAGAPAPAAPAIADAPFAGLEGIRFGRYSDNNKSFTKIQSWFRAEARFKARAYTDAFTAFFDHISDDDEGNVAFVLNGDKFTFEITQGSKKVYGHCDGQHISARASIALMEKPSNAVMRRLLDLNFSLRYSRCALDDDNALCMLFDSSVPMASPTKLYYGLREIAKFADRQDDLLVTDFESLKPADVGHIQPLPQGELDVKYRYFRQWIEESLRCVDGLNADTFSGAVSYVFLALLYRIDFLIVPEAKLMADLEAVSNMYWNRKEEIPIIERNAMMKEGIRKLLDITPEAFAAGVYRSKGTFSIVSVPPADKVREHIQGANKDAVWYVDHKYPDLALLINEYGMAYNQFSYSMPRPITDLTIIYMAVLHADFFRDLGMQRPFFDPVSGRLDAPFIRAAVDQAIGRWPGKYVSLHWDHGKVNYNTLWGFASTFSEQVAALNTEVRKVGVQ